MKTRITAYTFDASEQTITFTGYGSIDLDGVLIIVNVTDQVIIYNFADSAKGGTAATNVLTLEHDTTSMSDTDDLLIYYDDSAMTEDTTDLATESGGNLDTIAGDTTSIDGKITACNTGAVAGTVTAELSATDNAVLDAIEADTTTIAGDTTSIDGKITACNTGAIAGTVTANLSATDNAVLDTIAGDTTSLDGKVTACDTGAIAGTVTANLSATDNAVLDSIDSDTTTIAGDTTSIDGKITACDTGSIAGTVTANLSATDNAVLDSIDTDTSTIAGDTTSIDGKITACNTGAVTISAALPAGTNAIGKLAANSGVDIGDVDVTSQPARDRLTDNVGVALQTDIMLEDTTALAPKTAAIAASSSGDNTLVAAVIGKKIRVLAMQFVCAASVTVRLEDGAGGTALTGQMQYAANGGPVLGFNPVGWFETGTNTLLNMELSGAVSVAGSLTYLEVT